MINPNKNYKATGTGIITAIQNSNTHIDQFTVSYGTSGTYDGYVSDINNFKRFKLNDKVKCSMRFSITQDRFLISTMRKCTR